VPEQRAARQVPEPDVPERRPVPTARFTPFASVTLILPASATRPDAVTAVLFEATWPLLISIETDVPLGQAAFDEVIWTFQSPSNVAAVDGVAKPSTANSEAAIRDFEDVVMTCPFGLDAIKVSQWLLDDRDCHHAQKSPAFRQGFR
jgi:hypothetical protein